MLKENGSMRKVIGVFTSILILLIFVLHPESYIKVPKKYETVTNRISRRILHTFKGYIDPAFNESIYSYNYSEKPLDVVIPLVEKDIIIVKDLIKSIRAHVFHPIKTIYLVSPESTLIRELANQEGCVFVLENNAIPDFEKIKTAGNWILQQFIKLNVDQISSSDNILVVDADTVFLRNQTFINDKSNKYTINIHNDYCPYRKALTNIILKRKRVHKLDFVSHHMIFNSAWLKELKSDIENIYSKPWHEVLYEYAKSDKRGFSEYDIYATYIASKYPEKIKFLSSANVILYREKYKYFEMYRDSYAKDYKSISSHHFIKLEK